MHAPVSVIIPARNEAATIAQVVATMGTMASVAEVVVIDNASDDGTAAVAEAAGARVVPEARRGMGYAVRRGIAAARHDWVMKVDADLARFDTALFARMIEARAPGIGLVKGAWNDPADDMPMTRLLVRPALRLMFPGLGHLRAPNTGIYLFDRALIAHEHLTGDYAVDLDVMLRVHAAGAGVIEVDIGRIANNPRDPGHYGAMAEEILAFFLSRQRLDLLEEVVVLAPAGAEAIRHASGVMAQKLIAGARVSVYLEEGGEDADRLFAGFPTYARAPLDAVARHLPRANAARMRLITAPACRTLAENVRTALPIEIWEMPGADGFAADTGCDPGEGADLRALSLARLDPEAPPPAPCEVFRRLPLRRP